MYFMLRPYCFTILRVLPWPMWLREYHIGEYELIVFSRHILNYFELGVKI